ncbi:MAG: hypothetical protein ACKOW1_03120 [Novosphingobium sp.]
MIRARLMSLTAAASAAALLALAGCSKPAEQQAASSEPTAPSSEWVAENPTEPAVPVNLPNTVATRTGDAAQQASPATAAATPAAR